MKANADGSKVLFFYTGDLAAMLGRHRNTVDAMVKAKKLPKPIKIGGQNAWPKAVLLAFLGLAGGAAEVVVK